MNKLLGILLSASVVAWPSTSLLADSGAKKREITTKPSPTPKVTVVRVGKDAEKTKDQLSEVKEQLERVRNELASMKDREGKNRNELKALETKLAAAAKEAASESKRLLATANDISDWESRAKKAEGELQQTKRAMAITLRVANETKALGATQLAGRESTLSTTLASLKRSQEAAAECQAKVSELQAELEKQSKRYEAVAASLKKAETERDSYRKSKLAAEKSLTHLKGQLATMKASADKVPDLERQLAALRKTVSEKQQAEAAQVRVAARLAKSSEKMQSDLDEILLQREELHDNLTILRNEFAQYRVHSEAERNRLAKESVNVLQSSLAREGNKYAGEVKRRDDRLAQLEKALQEKEEALQATYKSEKETSDQLGKTAQARDAEAKARQALTLALEQLRKDLESSQKKARELKERLVDLEPVRPES